MKKILLCGLLSMLSIAHAGNVTSASKATATLASTCAFTINTLSFGNYDPISPAHQQASSNISALCSKGVAYSIGVDRYTSGDPYFNGVTSSVGFLNAAPALLNDANKLPSGTVMTPGTVNATKALIFNLFTDSSRTRAWTGYFNHWVTANQFITGVGTGTTQNIPFYGSIEKNQYVIPGSYSTNMTATINF